MNRNITLGQYYPGVSVFHKADPRMKIICGLINIVAVFLCSSVFSYLFLLLFTIGAILVSGVSARVIIKGLKPLLFIIILTAVLNLFWTNGDHVLLTLGFIKITVEGINFAILMILRITMLVIGTSLLLTYTTTPISLTSGLESVLSPLKLIKIPVHEFSMMIMIALRFIPTLIEETDKIMNAQKARCASIDYGGVISRVKALVPVLIPLFVSAFRRAEELATAMESRCYHGGNGRTKMNVLKLTSRDFLLLICYSLAIVAVLLINAFFYRGNFFGI